MAHCIKGSTFRISKLRCTSAPENNAFIITNSTDAVEMLHTNYNLAIIKNISVENNVDSDETALVSSFIRSYLFKKF